MKPPICDLCHNDFRCEYGHRGTGGGAVSFADFRALPEGAAGQAPGLEWFCDEHLASAKALTHLPHAGAMEHLRAEHGPFPEYPPLPALDPALWVIDVGLQPAKVFSVLRQATRLSPQEAKQRLAEGVFQVLDAWPAALEVWQQALVEAGATVEIRYPSSRNIQLFCR